jgi:hypothetical protein
MTTNPPTYFVYRLIDSNLVNKYQIIKEASFSNEQQAKEYIKAQCMLYTNLPTLLKSELPPNKRELFIDEFCFSNDCFIKERKFFLSIQNQSQLIEKLKNHNINCTL